MKNKSQVLFIIGFMATGKSTIGKLLSETLRYPLYDTDTIIERKLGKKVTEIFKDYGEKKFRELEKEVLVSLLGKERIIVSTGGGLPTFKDNLKLMIENGTVISLISTPESILKRAEKEGNTRPLLEGENKLLKIISLMEERAYAYIMADILVNTTNKNTDEIISEIKKRLR